MLNRKWVTRYSHTGVCYRVWEAPVPAIEPSLLNCVFYLYPTLNSAKKREQIGGTGFFVTIPLETNKAWLQVYAVTNRHCVVKAGDKLVLRINKAGGLLDFVETKTSDWIQHPILYDVAVLPFDLSPDHKVQAVATNHFLLTQNWAANVGIGPGDDVFMVGRFISQDGRQQNLPAVRFGNIARMNSEPIQDEYGIKQDSFLVEMRSISGFSGSPVFVFINPMLARPPHWWTKGITVYSQFQHGPWLLGIDWGHVPTFHSVLTANREDAVDPPEWVQANSGMAAVIPAWRLQEILDLPELVMQRTKDDERITEMKKQNSTIVND